MQDRLLIFARLWFDQELKKEMERGQILRKGSNINLSFIFSIEMKERVVVIRHTIKNALIPVVTLIGMQLPILIGGSVIMENIFNLPGLGRLMVNALEERDYPMVSGVNLVFATAVVGVNLFIDLIYPYFDPRVRYK